MLIINLINGLDVFSLEHTLGKQPITQSLHDRMLQITDSPHTVRLAVLHTLYGQMNYRSGGISLINLAEKISKAVTYGDTVLRRTPTKAIINSILIGLQI